MDLIHRLNVYLKPCYFAHVQRTLLIYSQMKILLYWPHSLTVTGVKSDKKSINLVSVSIFRHLKVTLKLKLQPANVSQIKTIYRSYIYYSLILFRFNIYKLQGKISEKM